MKQQQKSNTGRKALVKNGIGFPPHISDKVKRRIQRASSVMERMEVQWNYLGEDKHWKGMRQTAQCCKVGIPRTEKISWENGKGTLYQTSQDFVEVDFHESGKVVPRGTVKCNGLECSWCGRHKRKELADYLEMALSWNTREGGENVFGTLTQQVQIDPICVYAVSKAIADVLKKLDKWNKKNKCSIGMFSTQETTFSRVPKVVRFRDTTITDRGHYYHSHGHFILLVAKRDLPKKERLLELMREWWVAAIEKHGGYVFTHDRKSLINKDVAFRVEKSVAPDRATSRYITKHLKSMELVYAETKEGANLSLEQLKTAIHLDDTPHTNAYITMMRDYYKTLKHHSRFKSTKKIIADYVWKWKAHRDWLRTQEAYRQVIGNNYQILKRLGRTDEIHIISQIKDYELPKGEESEFHGGDTVGQVFGMMNLPKQKQTLEEQWRWRQEQIEDAMLNGKIEWNTRRTKIVEHSVDGNSIQLIQEVRAKEKELWDLGQWSYLEDDENRREDIVVATYKFASKLYNLIGKNKQMTRVLYRMRSWFLERKNEWFFRFINYLNHIFALADYEIEKALPKLELDVYKPNKKHFYELDPIVQRNVADRDKWEKENSEQWERYEKRKSEVENRQDARNTKIKQRNELFTKYLNDALDGNDAWLQKEVFAMDAILHSRKQTDA